MESESDRLFALVLWFAGWSAALLVLVSVPAWLLSRRLLRSRPDARGRRWAPWLASALPLLSLAGAYSLVLRAYLDAGKWPTNHEWTFEGENAYLSSPVPSDYPVHEVVTFLLMLVAGWGACFASVPLFVAYWRARALDLRAPFVFSASYALFLAWVAFDPGYVYWWLT